MKVKIFCVFIISALVYSCVSLPEASNGNQTLVVGIIIVRHNKTTKKIGTTLYLQELNGKKMYTIRSGSDGLFYSTKIPHGGYKLTKVVWKIGNTTWTTTSGSIYRIEIENGKVNNLGVINNTGNNKSATYTWNSGYGQVRDIFQQKYGSSNWFEKEWINNGINAPNSIGYTPAIVPRIEPTQPSTNDEDIWW